MRSYSALSIGRARITLEISAVNVYLSVEIGSAMNETAERLMDLAEARIRQAGYRGFSFRDLAAEIGIKSATISRPRREWPLRSRADTGIASSKWSRGGMMRAATTRLRSIDPRFAARSSGMAGCV